MKNVSYMNENTCLEKKIHWLIFHTNIHTKKGTSLDPMWSKNDVTNAIVKVNRAWDHHQCFKIPHRHLTVIMVSRKLDSKVKVQKTSELAISQVR